MGSTVFQLHITSGNTVCSVVGIYLKLKPGVSVTTERKSYSQEGKYDKPLTKTLDIR